MSKKSVMREMQQSSDLIHNIGSKQAEELAAARLVRIVTTDPPAAQGRANVNLTAVGKVWKGDKIEPVEPEPVVEPE